MKYLLHLAMLSLFSLQSFATVPKDARIYVAGHNGLVGSAVLNRLRSEGYENLIVRTSKELDLRNRDDVTRFFTEECPEYVYLCAAKVGGIYANATQPAEFIYDNLMIQCNVIDESYRSNVKKLLCLGSSCIYPKSCSQPIKESNLLAGPLEKTNEAYAIAKIAGLKMCSYYNKQYGTNFISCMPTNLYGPNDNYHGENSHVIPALIKKFHKAKEEKLAEVTVWGTGTPKREFMHVDDLARALVLLMDEYNSSEIINVGCGRDISIRSLAHLIKDIVGYEGKIVFDASKPDGTPRKYLDVRKLDKLGFMPMYSIQGGLKDAYDWYKVNINNTRG
ncbi:MAG: GDP-L-fucose synthase [Chlamydiia bacterium]|nr:GDP-L-fucose synthase [Chlamydiia bacterium]